MTRLIRGLMVALLALVFVPRAETSAMLEARESTTCTKIKDRVLVYQSGAMAGQVITNGVNPYGYNYQARSFSGSYFNAYAAASNLPPYDGDEATYLADNPTAGSHWAWPYREDELAMKWDDTWLSNTDCDNDGLLERHYGFTSYTGSGAWLTNHIKGSTTDIDGKVHVWTYFVKIVAPANANMNAGIWYDSYGSEIGPSIWGEFAILQEVYNDPTGGFHGVLYLSPTAAGFGRFGPK